MAVYFLCQAQFSLPKIGSGFWWGFFGYFNDISASPYAFVKNFCTLKKIKFLTYLVCLWRNLILILCLETIKRMCGLIALF